jgi:hypothetical protein
MTLIPRIVAIIGRLVTPERGLFVAVAASIFVNRGGRSTSKRPICPKSKQGRAQARRRSAGREKGGPLAGRRRGLDF